MPTLYTLRSRADTSNSAIISRNSIRPDSEDARGIRVIRSVALDIEYENLTSPKRVVVSHRDNSWEKRVSDEDLVHTSVHCNEQLFLRI